MSATVERVRRIAQLGIVTLAVGIGTVGQEPSAALKQADADYRAGTAELARNNLQSALQHFENVVRLAPSAEQGHSALGAVLLRMGKAPEAIRELVRALALKPGDSIAQLNLAVAYVETDQPQRALPWFAKLERTAHMQKHALPANVAEMYSRALAANNELPAAIVQMKQAAAAEPNNGELLDELGSIYALQKDLPNQQRAFEEAIALNPNLASAHMHLGVTLQSERRPGAIEELKKAYQLDPENPVIDLELGRELASEGDDDKAIPLFQRAVELHPGSTDATYQLGLALQRSNRASAAVPLLEKVAASDPANADVLINLGMALCQDQKAREAIPVLQKAVSLLPENPSARQDLAAAYIQLSQFDDAIGQLRAAIKLSPDSPQLHYNLGLALKMQDSNVEAISELEMAEKLNPSAAEPPYVLGVLEMQAARYSDAARELALSLRLQPDNGDGWATLGSVYNHLDRLPEASSALEEAIRQLPQQPDPHLTLAAVLTKENKPAEATAERRKAADLMRTNMNRQRAEVACNSGTSLLKAGKVVEAIVEFRNAIRFDSTYPEAHFGLATGLQMQGKVSEAAAERQKAGSLQGKPAT